MVQNLYFKLQIPPFCCLCWWFISWAPGLHVTFSLYINAIFQHLIDMYFRIQLQS